MSDFIETLAEKTAESRMKKAAAPGALIGAALGGGAGALSGGFGKEDSEAERKKKMLLRGLLGAMAGGGIGHFSDRYFGPSTSAQSATALPHIGALSDPATFMRDIYSGLAGGAGAYTMYPYLNPRTALRLQDIMSDPTLLAQNPQVLDELKIQHGQKVYGENAPQIPKGKLSPTAMASHSQGESIARFSKTVKRELNKLRSRKMLGTDALITVRDALLKRIGNTRPTATAAINNIASLPRRAYNVAMARPHLQRATMSAASKTKFLPVTGLGVENPGGPGATLALNPARMTQSQLNEVRRGIKRITKMPAPTIPAGAGKIRTGIARAGGAGRLLATALAAAAMAGLSYSGRQSPSRIDIPSELLKTKVSK